METSAIIIASIYAFGRLCDVLITLIIAKYKLNAKQIEALYSKKRPSKGLPSRIFSLISNICEVLSQEKAS